MKLGIGFMSAADLTRRRARTGNRSRHTTRDKKMRMVMRSEKSVATRARPKIEGLLSALSLIPSYR